MTAILRPHLVTTTSRSPLKVGFVCPHNPYDRRAFSGTAFGAARALEQADGIDVRILGNHVPPRALDRFLGNEAFDPKTLSFEGLDAIVGLVSSSLIDQIERVQIPFLHVSDATPQFLRACYGWKIPQEADHREARVAARADALVYSSTEIAALAETELGVSTHARPFGINMGNLPGSCPTPLPLTRLELLFVGTDWTRKGGDIAVEALNILRAEGRDVHLTVVGSLPSALVGHPAIKGVGYLNKNKSRHAAKLAQLYRKAHLLLLPSRADCTPMVVPEAMAFGTPVLATDIGGMGTLVGGAGTGQLLPLSATSADWADAVCKMTCNEMVYQTLSDACFERAHGPLTWNAWAAGIVEILQNIMARSDSERRESEIQQLSSFA